MSDAYKDFRQQVNAQALLVEGAEEFSEQQLAYRQRVIDIWDRHMPGGKPG